MNKLKEIIKNLKEKIKNSSKEELISNVILMFALIAVLSNSFVLVKIVNVAIAIMLIAKIIKLAKE